MQDKYVNPFTDFGFKKLFGEEPHKELLISFLNTLLPEKHQIQDLQYTRNLLQLNLIPETEIAAITGLTIEDIRQLRAKLDGAQQP